MWKLHILDKLSGGDYKITAKTFTEAVKKMKNMGEFEKFLGFIAPSDVINKRVKYKKEIRNA